MLPWGLTSLFCKVKHFNDTVDDWLLENQLNLMLQVEEIML